MEPNVCFLIFLKNNYLTICFYEPKGKFLNLEHHLASAHSLFPGHALAEKRFELQACLLLSPHEVALIVAHQPQVPHCRPGVAGLEAEAGLSVPQVWGPRSSQGLRLSETWPEL